MTTFTYHTVDADGKTIRGSVDAPDAAGAEQALRKLNIEPTDVREASRAGNDPRMQETPPPPSLKTTFVFEGRDDAGMLHRGTIQAESKHDAFERLRADHNLTLTLLCPMGIRAPAVDQDLLNWQPKQAPTLVPQPAAQSRTLVPTSPLPPSAPTKTFGFAGQSIPAKNVAPPATPAPTNADALRRYLPLADTLRLYAGWLLAWYGLFIALGYYALNRLLPWDIPFVQAFSSSLLIFSFIIIIFLFLLLGSLHKAINGKLRSGLVFTVVGIVAFLTLRLSA